MQRSAVCRSRRELSNAYLLAKFCFDTAENEPYFVSMLPRGRRSAAEDDSKGEPPRGSCGAFGGVLASDPYAQMQTRFGIWILTKFDRASDLGGIEAKFCKKMCV